MADETVETTEAAGGDQFDAAASQAQTEDTGTVPAAVETAPAAAPDPAAAPEVEPFYRYGERAFKDANELTEHIRRGTMNFDDYSQRVQAMNQQAQQRQLEYQQWQQGQQQNRPMMERYQRLEQLLQTRPDIQRYIQQLVGQAPSSDTVAQRTQSDVDRIKEELRREYQPLVSDHQARQQQGQFDSKLSGVLSDRTALPNGADEVKVRDALEQIRRSPDPGREVMLLVGRLFAGATPLPAVNAPPARGVRRPSGRGPGAPASEAEGLDGITSIDEIRDIALARESGR